VLFGWDWMCCLVGIGCVVWLGLDVLFGWDWMHPVRAVGNVLTICPFNVFIQRKLFSTSVRLSRLGCTKLTGKEVK